MQGQVEELIRQYNALRSLAVETLLPAMIVVAAATRACVSGDAKAKRDVKADLEQTLAQLIALLGPPPEANGVVESETPPIPKGD